MSATVMGAAVPVMHYTGMDAATFTRSSLAPERLRHALEISSLGTACVIVATLMIQGFTIVSSLMDRRYTSQTMVLQSSEKRARQILETSFDAFVELDPGERIRDWNAEATRIFGWSLDEVEGKRLVDTIIPADFRGKLRRARQRSPRCQHGSCRAFAV